MLKRLLVKNFQCHEARALSLDRITTIVGPNDSGKSSFLRAICFLLFNKAPKNFIAWDSKDCYVAGMIDDHKVINRRRKNKSWYELDGATLKRDSNQHRVPQPLIDLFHSEEALNFQPARDTAFWFGQTPGQISQRLNRIINLDSIDKSLKYLADERRQAQTLLRDAEHRQAQAQAEQQKLAMLPKFANRLEQLEKREKQLHERQQRCENLRTIVADLKRTGQRAAQLKKLAAQAELVQQRATQYLTKQTKTAALRDLLDNLAEQQRIEKWQRKQYAAIEKKIQKLTKGRCPICQKTF